MAFVIKTAKTVRNHWKKSIFASVVLLYGYRYAKDYFETQDLMRVYCEKAANYGRQTIPIQKEPRQITIILNPNANKRKATDEFEKYCAPILHLAGICVNLLKTESEGHAKSLINDINNTDAIIVAGGDGTLSEVLTGLLRRTNENTNGLIPVGILPLGRTNSVAKSLFLTNGNLEKIRNLAEATMAIVEEITRPLDVMRIDVIDNEDGDKNKSIYAASGIKWGAYRDADTKQDNYWFYGRFRKYATYIFNGYKSNLTWNCKAFMNYTPPCSGCLNCTKTNQINNKWFYRFKKSENLDNRSLNPNCSLTNAKNISTVDFDLSVSKDAKLSKLLIKIGPERVDYFDFVKNGWRSVMDGERQIKETIEARTVEIRPKIEKKSEDNWFSIDNENFELKPIKITLLPNLINVFCNKAH